MRTYVKAWAGPLALAVLLTDLTGCTAERETGDPPSDPGQTKSSWPSVPASGGSTSPAPQGLPAGSDPAVPAAVAKQPPTTGVPEPRVRADVMARERLGMVAESARMMAPMSAPQIACCLPPYFSPADRENYEHFTENPVRLASEHPVSTFSIDVDTGSYANVRRFLNEGQLPPEDAVRVEELINYFGYDYPAPRDRAVPFSVTTAAAPAPWNKDRLLLQIAIKGYEVPADKRPAANLVFLVDVSGSMMSADKLPLLKNSLRLLTRQLRATDRVSMVVYAGAAGAVLEPTAGDRQADITAAIDRLEAGGSTNGADGIRLAYDFARQSFIRGGINRVLLATDGDFNVGTVNFEALVDLAEREREGGVALTTLGFGTGNYNDQLLERLADAGNGNYAYVDTLSEARKALVEQMSGTLQTIAKDVKIQVEFNPSVVAEYRLIGYENRALRREDFNNDRIDAGEIGSGHTVTALYELALVGSAGRLIDPLRYGGNEAASSAGSGEIAHVRLRYKAPEGDTSRLIEQPVRQADVASASPQELRFAAAVAAFGQLLRGGEYLGDFGYDDVAELARNARGDDRMGYRSEFLRLVALAESLGAGEAPQARVEDRQH